MHFHVAYLHLALFNYKGQGQRHAHFNYEYIVNGYRYGDNLLIDAFKYEIL